MTNRINLEAQWLSRLQDQFDADYMRSLADFLRAEKARGVRIFPPGAEIFNALESTPFDRVKVVILGQDPYHGPGQAHGLCFSVAPGVPIPPSLLNIYKELESDLACRRPGHGHLAAWAEQGVLLLNSVLTVEAGKAASHQGKGWERFTDRIVALLNEQRENLVFLLWGSYAQKKGSIVDESRHLVLRSAHPSPLSAHRGFLGNRHFSQCNAYLKHSGQEPIEWQLNDPGVADGSK